MPLLLTEQHFAETMEVYQRVKDLAAAHDDLSADAVNARLDLQLANNLRAVRNNLKTKTGETFNSRNAGAVIGGILRLIDHRDMTRTHGAVREWDAFRDIIRIGNGLFKLSEYRPDGTVLDAKTISIWDRICKDCAAGEGADEIEALKSVFQQPIARAKSRLNHKQSDIDAGSIAEVAYLNHRLQAENADLRVVLMTGDRGMSLALANDRSSVLSGLHQTISEFAFGHVRHLWSFVDIFKDDSSSTSNTKELFSGLLAFEEESKKEDDFRTFLLNNATHPNPSYVRRIGEDEVHDAYERWEMYTEQAADNQKHYLFDNLKRDRISEVILKKFHSTGAKMDGLELLAIVRETTARARDLANVEFSGIGASSLLDRHKNGIRNPPELMFDSLAVTDRIFRDLALPKRVFLTLEDFAARFDQISTDCYQPDPTDADDDDLRQECYLKYLVLGALFASANRWIVAEQHAESAVRIIERAKALKDPIRTKETGIGIPRSHMSGREAYFLLASSKRVRARTDRRFEEAQRELENARQCLLEDRAEGTALGVPFIRFDVSGRWAARSTQLDGLKFHGSRSSMRL